MSSIILAAEGGTTVTEILGSVTSLLTWALTSMTSIVNWVVSTPLAMVYVGMFVVGFAVAALFRVLHSA